MQQRAHQRPPFVHAVILAEAMDVQAVVSAREDPFGASTPQNLNDIGRPEILAALREPRSVRGYVRVNAADTRWCLEDVDAVVGPWLDGIVLPKAESPGQLQALDARIAEAERHAGVAPGSIDLMAIIETALGVESAGPIAAAVPRLARLAFGGGDYTHDLDLVWTEGEAELAYARARIAHASRIAGLEPPVDTVVLQVRDAARFRRSAEQGRAMGFAAKLCIHPDQVQPCNEAFTPAREEVERARAIVRAFEAAEAAGSASIQLSRSGRPDSRACAQAESTKSATSTGIRRIGVEGTTRPCTLSRAARTTVT